MFHVSKSKLNVEKQLKLLKHTNCKIPEMKRTRCKKRRKKREKMGCPTYVIKLI